MLDHKDIVEEIKVIVFRLKDEEYGVEVNQVKSIERLEHITRVPRTPQFIKGVINMRGIVTPIVDLRRRFGIEEATYNETTRVIIVAIGEIEVGLIVDSANDVIDIPINAIEPPPEVVGGIEAVYLRGVAKLDRRLLILLNLNKVLNTDEIKQLENIEA
ncbi:chemotaxis protein CheW [Aneurinibacillus aneurinilyticus]|uniref:Purine-binding chemotaxis protein CheW n=2 Tax=Aneurinibacillus aneurinilyticus TaxID=1391 RepID=A0A848CUN1_ANEAE|nr:chemotaxis protein CheW [Aneurinibacillus aneurinilyticus]ERI09232.1 putative chemotaxis protein CheW [Aneurinibacillus aneurinilyticus ATCC 12856]MCI1692416.1 chemotaxis protein CheW [Aneurinibacillus aneurinilyticus]MED0669341.1 chemotaxis protein CheW [Aneurinibacillus aneurinilyticus]MED0707412.1 chemotaxis protein CheW [Aneurinibacillus aneurinilyticus]MED0724780.1 chemotaxis protein CheW [Aneurinibacillus aneurinilyticus]